jgi:hypothetical protein
MDRRARQQVVEIHDAFQHLAGARGGIPIGASDGFQELWRRCPAGGLRGRLPEPRGGACQQRYKMQLKQRERLMTVVKRLFDVDNLTTAST